MPRTSVLPDTSSGPLSCGLASGRNHETPEEQRSDIRGPGENSETPPGTPPLRGRGISTVTRETFPSIKYLKGGLGSPPPTGILSDHFRIISLRVLGTHREDTLNLTKEALEYLCQYALTETNPPAVISSAVHMAISYPSVWPRLQLDINFYSRSLRMLHIRASRKSFPNLLDSIRLGPFPPPWLSLPSGHLQFKSRHSLGILLFYEPWACFTTPARRSRISSATNVSPSSMRTAKRSRRSSSQSHCRTQSRC